MRDSAILTRPAFVGRYSYEDPPAPGDTVITPSGRTVLVINVNPERFCICQRPDGTTITFAANELRYHYR